MGTLKNIYTRDEKGELNPATSITPDCIMLPDPAPFNTNVSIMRTTNKKLSELIKATFGAVMHDLKGVYVWMPVVDQYQCEFYFEWNNAEVPDGKIKNLRYLSVADGTIPTAIAYQSAMINQSQNKHYELTDETKILLAPYMYGGKDANKLNSNSWEKNVEEKHYSANTMFYQAGAEHFIMRVSGFDVKRLCKLVYGNRFVVQTINTKGDDGVEKAKNITAEAWYNLQHGGYSKSEPVTIINIERLDKDTITDMMVKENPPMQFYANGGMPMMY